MPGPVGHALPLASVSSALRWRVIAVAGRADAVVTLEDLEALVAALVAADTLRWVGPIDVRWPGTVTWAAPNTWRPLAAWTT